MKTILPNSKTKEEILSDAIKNGELSIDEKGQIWRHSIRVGGRLGRVKILNKPIRAENVIKNKTGRRYYQIQLSYDNQRYIYMSHRIVWEFFNGKIPNGHIVHHINDNTLDNNPANLKCVTHSWHNKHHPRTPWNKGLSKNNTHQKGIYRKPWNKGLSGNDINSWHDKTIITKKKNYAQRAKNTYALKYNNKMRIKDIAELQGITTRSVHQRIKDYKEEVMQCP